VVEILGELLQTELTPSENLFESMQSMRPFTAFSGSLKECSLELIRIANDFRLLSSGPNTGLFELILPPVQPGSSIMPGKVNPVMAEMLNMVCFQIVGNDTAVSMAAQAGQLELNVMMPVIIHNILHSMTIMRNAVNVFAQRCVKGIQANRESCRRFFDNTLGLATVLNAIIGYDQAATVMKESLAQRKTILQYISENNILSSAQIESIFSAQKLTNPGVPKLD
jgi:aspartate ammonia-lyase